MRDGGVAVVERHHHRRHAVGIRLVHVGAGADDRLPRSAGSRRARRRAAASGRRSAGTARAARWRSASPSRWTSRARRGRPSATPGTRPSRRAPRRRPTSARTGRDRSRGGSRRRRAGRGASPSARCRCAPRASAASGRPRSTTLASAPASSSMPASSRLATRAASASGLAPYLLTTSALAPAPQERRHQLAIDAIDGPVERRRAVRLRLVDVGAGGDQRQRGLAVAGLDLVGECRLRLRGCGEQAERERRPRARSFMTRSLDHIG